MLTLKSLMTLWCIPDSTIGSTQQKQFLRVEENFIFPEIQCPICVNGLIKPIKMKHDIYYAIRCVKCQVSYEQKWHGNLAPELIKKIELDYRTQGILPCDLQAVREHFAYPYEKLNNVEQKIIDSFINGGYCNLILVGSTGNHKTTVAWALLERWSVQKTKDRQNIKISMVKFCQLLKWFSESAGFSEYANNQIQKLSNSELLFIDDFGITMAHTKATQDGIYNLIDYRYENKLSTIITSNVDPKEWGERISSRLASNSVVSRFNGGDERFSSANLIIN